MYDTEKHAAYWLKSEWRRELVTIQKCIDCYHFWTMHEMDNDYFTWVCSGGPHLLVYVQEVRDEYAWWPAKVISNDGNRTVTIEYFGCHLRWEYPFNQCVLYADTGRDLHAKAKNAKNSKRENFKAEFKRAFTVREDGFTRQNELWFFIQMFVVRFLGS